MIYSTGPACHKRRRTNRKKEPRVSTFVSSLTDITEILVSKYDVKPEAIKPESTLTEIGLDSLSIAELMFDVADKYDIDVPDDRANFNTLGEAFYEHDSEIETVARECIAADFAFIASTYGFDADTEEMIATRDW